MSNIKSKFSKSDFKIFLITLFGHCANKIEMDKLYDDISVCLDEVYEISVGEDLGD